MTYRPPKPFSDLIDEMNLRVVKARRSKHDVVVVEAPTGERCTVTVSRSPSDDKTYLNLRALLRRNLRGAAS